MKSTTKLSHAGEASGRSGADASIYKIAFVGLFAALSYIVFTFLQIKITLPGGDATSIHLGNAVCVLGALLMGGIYGNLCAEDPDLQAVHRPDCRGSGARDF